VQASKSTHDFGLLHEFDLTLYSSSFVFPKQKLKNTFIDNGTLGISYEVGSMLREEFFQWLKIFSSFVKCGYENNAVLISDGHSSPNIVQVVPLHERMVL
jgi:hypothetical protein